MTKSYTELRPIKESVRGFDAVEKRIRTKFRELLYLPILREISSKPPKLENDDDPLAAALLRGDIRYEGGIFTGTFAAETSKRLRALGAVWDPKRKVFRLPARKLPHEIRYAASISQGRFEKVLAAIDKKLSQILPEEIAGAIRVADLFDKAIWKTDKAVATTLRRITVAPELTVGQRQKIAEEWQENMDLWIKDFAEKEIRDLREKVRKAAFAGQRRETLVGTIQKSYGVTKAKARFLAKQETSLLVANLKETRYTDAGITEYKWGCVTGSPLHPVRPSHKKLEGRIFSWKDPPITTAPNEPARRNNPGKDYGCRCFAIPVVNFKGKRDTT